MPSWNIHTAHAEHLLAQGDATALGIQDVNAFLLGNLLPDVYVGYMVPDVSHKIPYAETHYADPNFVPEPRYDEFFDRFATPGKDGKVSDLILGSWAHLVADHDYNLRANTFFQEHGIQPCTETRVKKQGDFDLFGRTLNISLIPHITDEVLRQCAIYPPYTLDPEDMRRTEAAMARIVADNASRHVYGAPAYQMLGADFFSRTFSEVTAHIRMGLLAYAAGDTNWGKAR